MKDMFEVANAGVRAQHELDVALTEAYNASMRLVEVTERGLQLGMMTKAIAAKTILADARTIPGQIAAVAAAAARLHADQTKACQLNGCDVPSPSSVGGVVIKGGGDR